MKKLQQILFIRESVEQIISGLTAIHNWRKFIEHNETYANMVLQFFTLNADWMAREQYEAAKVDAQYFMRLVNLAMAHWSKDN